MSDAKQAEEMPVAQGKEQPEADMTAAEEVGFFFLFFSFFPTWLANLQIDSLAVTETRGHWGKIKSGET